MADDQLQPIVQRMIDAGESEANIATVIQHFKAQQPPPVDRGGLYHPLTSVIAPELEAARGKVNSALETPHGQPVMARSRTGGLYLSETGTGAVNAMKAGARGAAGEVIDQAENVTSPLGMLAAGASMIPKRAVAGTLRVFGNALESPTGLVRQVKGMVGRGFNAVADAISPAAVEMPPAPAAPTGPHMDRSVPVRPSELTPQQLSERIFQGSGTPPPPAPAKGQLRLTQQAPSDSPLVQPRIDVGAEVVGRQNGLTTDAVRQQTGPILGEEPGSASPILPEKALQRIVDTLRAIPPGSPDREAYVRAATSGKAQWQIENIRRTLEHLGLLVPIAAGAAAANRD